MPETGDEHKKLEAAFEDNRRLRQEIKRLRLLLSSTSTSVQAAAEDFSHLSQDVARVIQALQGLLELVLKDYPCFVAYSDKDLRYLHARCLNNRAGNLQCHTPVDSELQDVLPEAPYLAELKASVLRSGAAERQELQILVEERMRYLVLTCKPFYKEGRVDGVISVSVDVTSQFVMEEHVSRVESQLEASKMELEECKLVEQYLRKRVDMADQAIEAKNSFLAVMSHEIRTPLNGVLGMAQVLANTTLDQEQKELVDAMVFSGDVILAIISDTLDLTKVESGTMKLEERAFNPRDVVKHVVKASIAAIKNPGVCIASEISEDVPPMVIGDPLRLKQVITNLVFNAVKFTKEGHIRIYLKPVKSAKPEAEEFALLLSRAPSVDASQASVENADIDNRWDVLVEGCRRDLLAEDSDECQSMPEQSDSSDEFVKLPKAHSDPGPGFETNLIWLQFAVEDTGIGIPEEAFPSLFEKFTQVHSSTTRKYGGTGLGLAICKQLVELMGGRITVSSKVGVGSTFVFTVCCWKKPRPGQQQQAASCITPANDDKAIYKLQAELSTLVSSTLSCPLTDMLKVEFGMDKVPVDMDKAELEVTSTPCLRRTSSGPSRIECAVIRDVSNLQTMSTVTLGGRRRQPRILLAEDNKVNVLVALSMLKQLGLSAEVAYNGQQALEAIQNKRYDLVLMDVCMPVLDGLEVTQRVRMFERTGSWDECVCAEPERRKRLPIIATTANASLDVQEQCLQNGMDSFLTKPIDFRKLKDMLAQYLDQNSLDTSTELRTRVR